MSIVLDPFEVAFEEATKRLGDVEVERAIERAVKLLDERVPDWREEVDVDSLLMQDCGRCVLGQLYGGYWRGMRELGLEDEQAYLWGFNINYDAGQISDAAVDEQFSRLQRAWEEELRVG